MSRGISLLDTSDYQVKGEEAGPRIGLGVGWRSENVCDGLAQFLHSDHRYWRCL
jgi:hypothetical protein